MQIRTVVPVQESWFAKLPRPSYTCDFLGVGRPTAMIWQYAGALLTGWIESPISGADGNLEYLIGLRRTET